MAKFKKGDKVKIVNYGGLAWIYAGEYGKWLKAGFAVTPKPKHLLGEAQDDDGRTVYQYDTCPYMVGRTGVVDKVTLVQGITEYSLKLIEDGGKVAWYFDNQLKLIT